MIMGKKEKTGDAVKILHGRYVKGDAERKASVESERVNAEVAQLIYDLRKGAGLSQQELGELVGTTQSVISRLEDADYDGHSLSMLNRIAGALRQELTVVMTAQDPETGALRYAFHLCVQMLRRANGLTVDELATKTGIDRSEVVAMERNPGYRPTPVVVHKLSAFYGISERRMAMLAGAVREVSADVAEEASRFAAQSESFAKLTEEEKQALDEFMKVLRADAV
jgi:transcriptional regulator with XRE-family HTH domain